MNPEMTVRAWRNKSHCAQLSAEQRSELPQHSAGGASLSKKRLYATGMRVGILCLAAFSPFFMACGAPQEESVAEKSSELEMSAPAHAETTGRPFKIERSSLPTHESSAESHAAAIRPWACYEANNFWGWTVEDACNNSWNAGAAQCDASFRFNVSYGSCSGKCYVGDNSCFVNTTECCN